VFFMSIACSPNLQFLGKTAISICNILMNTQ
jgi:hypothetical protein